MLKKLDEASKMVELHMNFEKTQVITNNKIKQEAEIRVNYETLPKNVHNS